MSYKDNYNSAYDSYSSNCNDVTTNNTAFHSIYTSNINVAASNKISYTNYDNRYNKYGGIN